MKDDGVSGAHRFTRNTTFSPLTLVTLPLSARRSHQGFRAPPLGESPRSFHDELA